MINIKNKKKQIYTAEEKQRDQRKENKINKQNK